jgi:hypothetical protein
MTRQAFLRRRLRDRQRQPNWAVSAAFYGYRGTSSQERTAQPGSKKWRRHGRPAA